MGSLPEGYRIGYFRYGPQPPDEPLLLTLSRTADDSVVAHFVLGDLKETMRMIENAAWRDHREKTLRSVNEGEDET